MHPFYLKLNSFFYLKLNSFLFKVELFCLQITLNGRCQTYAAYRTFLSMCGFNVFGPYILQNPRGKSNNSILVLNTFLHEKQGII